MKQSKVRFYKFAFYKRCFDVGTAVLSIPTKILTLAGFAAILAGMSAKFTLILGVFYCVICFLIGIVYFKSGFAFAEAEVANQYNMFVRQMRKRVKVIRSAE